MQRADVSVLTPVLNEERYIRDAVAGMRAQRFDGRIELIFIDGRSMDRTVDILRELAADDDRICVLDNPAQSTPVALNIGLRAATGAYIARMDAHTHYPPDYLSDGVRRLAAGGAEHVSGPQLPQGVGKWSRRVALALGTRLGTGGAAFRRGSKEEFEVDSGFTGIWTRATLDRYGGWDEGWPNDQDSELAARIRADGGRIICLPEMAAGYIPRDSLTRLARQYWRYGFFRAKTSRRHPESMRRSHVLAPGLALAVGAAALPFRPLALPARAGVALYAGAVLAVSAGAAREDEIGDAAWLPAIFACMHLPWGFGFLAGSARFGPPLQALSLLVKRSMGHGIEA